MSRLAASMPKRLRAAGATRLERRLLEAAAQEQPPPELVKRMAQGLGVSVPALGASAGTALGTAGAAAKSGAAWSSILPWLAGGLAVAAVAGGVLAARVGTTLSPPVRPAAPEVSDKASSVSAPAGGVEEAPMPPATGAAPTAPEASAAASIPSAGATSTPQRSGASTTASTLGDQIALVDAAHAAVSAGASDRALEILRQYADKYPGGSFHLEATALKIEALTRLGRNAEARTLAERFVAKHRGSPLAVRVARIAGIASP